MLDKIFNKCLLQIEDTVLAMRGQYLQHYGLPQQLRSEEILENREYLKEFRYDTSVLIQIVTKNEVLLTDEQQFVYHQF